MIFIESHEMCDARGHEGGGNSRIVRRLSKYRMLRNQFSPRRINSLIIRFDGEDAFKLRENSLSLRRAHL